MRIHHHLSNQLQSVQLKDYYVKKLLHSKEISKIFILLILSQLTIPLPVWPSKQMQLIVLVGVVE
jgi:hypothetical protein